MRAKLLRECDELVGRVDPFDLTARRPCEHPAELGGCGEVATWRPVLLLVPSREYSGKPRKVPLSTVVCARHRQMRAEHFLASGELWERIVELFGREGKAPPYREGTRVEYVRQGLDS